MAHSSDDVLRTSRELTDAARRLIDESQKQQPSMMQTLKESREAVARSRQLLRAKAVEHADEPPQSD